MLFTVGLACAFALSTELERLGLSRAAVGYGLFLLTVLLYAGIGIRCRTNDVMEFYVAGRRVPSVFNGMATAADWLSSAAFFGLTGAIFLRGFGGLSFVYGWTGGLLLVAMLVAPHLQRFGHLSVADFLAARYGGAIARWTGIVITVLICLPYLVAQIFVVGLIAQRLTHVPFEIGIWIGLGGVIVCSFLGGMKAVTWTQVAQFIVLALAYVVPVVWGSINVSGQPIPTLGLADQLPRLAELERRLEDDPTERAVRETQARVAAQARARLDDPARSYARERLALLTDLDAAESAGDEARTLRARERLAAYPASLAAARAQWTDEAGAALLRQPGLHHTEPFEAASETGRRQSRLNFIAQIVCLMLGTVGMPHLLVRSYGATSGREARRSMAWALLLVVLVLIHAPALAVLAKYLIYSQLVGAPFDHLPDWVDAWRRIDPGLIALHDVNGDGIVQRAELKVGTDFVVLALPDLAGLPVAVSALVAAGGLAAALATANGLLLAITGAIAHDGYARSLRPHATAARRVMVGKFVLLIVAAVAAVIAARHPDDLLIMVSLPFSIAASTFFPALVLGIVWKRATAPGAVFGMIAGLATTAWYLLRTHPVLREWARGIPRHVPIDHPFGLGIEPLGAGVIGAAVALAVIVCVSLLSPRPSSATRRMVDRIRRPTLEFGGNDYNAASRRDG